MWEHVGREVKQFQNHWGVDWAEGKDCMTVQCTTCGKVVNGRKEAEEHKCIDATTGFQLPPLTGCTVDPGVVQSRFIGRDPENVHYVCSECPLTFDTFLDGVMHDCVLPGTGTSYNAQLADVRKRLAVPDAQADK